MNVDRYLDRVGLNARPSADPAGLAALQTAHRLAFGFENLDVMLGRAIQIDALSVFEKLVVRRRGGYCFEQNRLFADALDVFGILSRPLLARVWLGQPEGVVPPRTHTALLATLDGDPWLADAGFGGSNLPPLPLQDGAEAETSDGARHRLRRTGECGSRGGEWLLGRAGPAAATDGRAQAHGGWQPQYSFDFGDVAQADLEQANHWTSTRPGTRFTTLHVASIALPSGFASMMDRQLTIHDHAGTKTRWISDAADYTRTLQDIFQIRLAEDEAAALPLFGQ